MINGKDHPVEWALLAYELDDAIEHLQALSKDFIPNGDIDETDFEVKLGHVYAHLNRAWNSRNRIGESDQEQLELESRFPTDLYPYG